MLWISVPRECALGARSGGGNATKHLPMTLSEGHALAWSLGCAGALGLAFSAPRWIARYGPEPPGLRVKTAMTALLMTVASNLLLSTERVWIGMGLGAVLLALTIIDLVALRLPDVLTLPLICAGLLEALFAGDNLPGRALAASLGYGSFVALDEAYRRLRGRSGLGRGDAKLFAAAGAWLGPASLPTLVIWACAGALIMLAMRVLTMGFGAVSRPLPFGPALCVAFWMNFIVQPLGG